VLDYRQRCGCEEAQGPYCTVHKDSLSNLPTISSSYQLTLNGRIISTFHYTYLGWRSGRHLFLRTAGQHLPQGFSRF